MMVGTHTLFAKKTLILNCISIFQCIIEIKIFPNFVSLLVSEYYLQMVYRKLLYNVAHNFVLRILVQYDLPIQVIFFKGILK